MNTPLDAQQRLSLKKNEKRAFFLRYGVRVVEEVYKRRFFDLFDNRCFRCGAPEDPTWVCAPRLLCMDHHIPFARGGRFEAGNLVSLCRSCNSSKGNKDPAIFYPQRLLTALQPLLDVQENLFAFEWDNEKWRSDRAGYLAEIGVPHEQIHLALNDEYFYGYIYPDTEDNFAFSIAIDLSSFESLLHDSHPKEPPESKN